MPSGSRRPEVGGVPPAEAEALLVDLRAVPVAEVHEVAADADLARLADRALLAGAVHDAYGGEGARASRVAGARAAVGAGHREAGHLGLSVAPALAAAVAGEAALVGGDRALPQGCGDARPQVGQVVPGLAVQRDELRDGRRHQIRVGALLRRQQREQFLGDHPADDHVLAAVDEGWDAPELVVADVEHRSGAEEGGLRADVPHPRGARAHREQVAVGEHRAGLPSGDRRGVDDQERGVGVDATSSAAAGSSGAPEARKASYESGRRPRRRGAATTPAGRCPVRPGPCRPCRRSPRPARRRPWGRSPRTANAISGAAQRQ